MASLVGEQLKDTYDSLLKTSDNDALGGTYKEITDGAGNGSGLYLGTGGNVGIGTNSPSADLTVTDGTSAGTLSIGNDSASTSVRYLQFGETNDYSIQSNANSYLRFHAEGAERMRIDSSGNVGIGTTSPDTILDIAGTTPTLTINDTQDKSWVSGDELGGISWRTNDASGAGAREVGFIHIEAESAGTTMSGAMVFGSSAYDASATERLRIDSSGNVGIGTTSPAVELDVDGEIRAKDGILFGTDTATANALDDYEEGTWTPVYAPQTGSFATMTMDVVSATYTKIGRQVTVRAFIRTDNVDATGASGVLKIDGLPFTVATLQDSAGSIGDTLNWTNPPDGCFVEASTSKIVLKKTNITGTSVVGDLATGAVADQNILRLTATYFV